MKRDRILLSDSAVVTKLLSKAVFRRKNCRFSLARNGDEIWSALEKEIPDLIFLDLDLPGVNEALCRLIKEDPRFQAIPLVAVSASGTARDVRRFRAAGCDDVLVGSLRGNRLAWLTKRLLRLPIRTQGRTCAHLRIRYGASPAEVHAARTLNLGTGGVLIEAPRPLPLDTPIFLELFLPDSDQPIRCRGRIAWSGREEESGPAEMGVEFLGMSPEDKDSIRQFIEGDEKVSPPHLVDISG